MDIYWYNLEAINIKEEFADINYIKLIITFKINDG